MVSRAVTIAQDVVDVIEVTDMTESLSVSIEQPPTGWSTDATVVRAYLAEYAMEDLEYTRCTVIPATYEATVASRSAMRETFGIDIVLQGRPADADAKDSLMELAEEINEALENATLTNSGACWVGVERTPLFQSQALDEGGILAMSSRHTFRLVRAVA
jgi:hypothetical protein